MDIEKCIYEHCFISNFNESYLYHIIRTYGVDINGMLAHIDGVFTCLPYECVNKSMQYIIDINACRIFHYNKNSIILFEFIIYKSAMNSNDCIQVTDCDIKLPLINNKVLKFASYDDYQSYWKLTHI